MKKIIMFLMVAVLMLGISGQAMAAFQDGDLVRVVFSDQGVYETATDLGAITNLTANTGANVVYSTDKFSLAALGGNATAANSYVVYYSVAASPNRAWVSGSTSLTTMTGVGSAYSGFAGGAHSAAGLYQVQGGGATQVTVQMSDPASFWTQLTNSGLGIGNMKGYVVASSGLATASLADLTTVGYVDQKLFYFATASGIGNRTGVQVATIRTYADGHTELNPAATTATPIPAAVYLLGSGLLGLVGIRRKMAA
jgi:hypothetical protein